MSFKLKVTLVLSLSLIAVILAIGIGSVYISPSEIMQIIALKIFNQPTEIAFIRIGIIWNMRLPRVILSFMAGSLLSVSGTVMQSILKNTLASSYTLGVSSGAAFGIGLSVFIGIPASLIGIFTFPVIGLAGGILTVILAVTFAAKMDKSMGNQTIVLVGMVFSLFMNALLTLMSSLSGETLQKMIYWQMGSFALKDWSFVIILLPITIVGTAVLIRFSRELDHLTFGEDTAFAAGVNVKKIKWMLLSISAALTGCVVALVGVIGFVDLIIPHVARKIFGSSHRVLIPLSAVMGGVFMVIADVIARTVVTPSELPIGAVTAIIGAPFFIYVYFKRKVVK